MNLPTLKNLNVKNKTILVRIDVNSPVVRGKVLDNPRFEASAKTIKYLIKNKAKVTIITHQGRKGEHDFLPLQQHAKILSKYVKRKISYIDDLFGEKAKERIKSLKAGKAILLKNVRSYDDEINPYTKGNRYKEFCKLFDLYINEAFSVSHREQGSIVNPPKYLPSFIGLEFEKEITALKKFAGKKTKNKVFILGGQKIEDYFSLFAALRNKKNKILAAGVLANLFLVAKGHSLGYEEKWLKQNNYLKLIPKLRKIYNKYQNQIILPVDFGLVNGEKRIDVVLEQAPYPYKIYDIGYQTVNLFKNELAKADYVFMKGPLGFSEIPAFSTATKKILRFIAQRTRSKKIFSILGGGHLTTTIKKYNLPNSFSYASLSGGALIAYISGKKLPGIEVLQRFK